MVDVVLLGTDQTERVGQVVVVQPAGAEPLERGEDYPLGPKVLLHGRTRVLSMVLLQVDWQEEEEGAAVAAEAVQIPAGRALRGVPEERLAWVPVVLVAVVWVVLEEVLEVTGLSGSPQYYLARPIAQLPGTEQAIEGDHGVAPGVQRTHGVNELQARLAVHPLQ